MKFVQNPSAYYYCMQDNDINTWFISQQQISLITWDNMFKQGVKVQSRLIWLLK